MLMFSKPFEQTLTCGLITFNAEKYLRECLQSIAFADEIIIVDSGSTDKTLEIAKEFGASITYSPMNRGFGAQKQLLLNRARSHWFLLVDSDEVLTEELAAEIYVHTKRPQYEGMWIRRVSYCCGRKMQFGEWRNDWVLRLVRTAGSFFTADMVHERLCYEGSCIRAKHVMHHYTYSTPIEIIEKQLSYAKLASHQKHLQKRTNIAVACFASLYRFLYSYILKLGFLDGYPGFFYCVARAHGVFWKYVFHMSNANRSD